mmetsp:Transcript_1648/g.5621  ORF Transcript_1648/g.5621 Transcript_1648/m.5621 type:complete len:221 (-) Transcript_1648:529-1191(-)
MGAPGCRIGLGFTLTGLFLAFFFSTAAIFRLVSCKFLCAISSGFLSLSRCLMVTEFTTTSLSTAVSSATQFFVTSALGLFFLRRLCAIAESFFTRRWPAYSWSSSSQSWYPAPPSSSLAADPGALASPAALPTSSSPRSSNSWSVSVSELTSSSRSPVRRLGPRSRLAAWGLFICSIWLVTSFFGTIAKVLSLLTFVPLLGLSDRATERPTCAASGRCLS